MGNLGESFVDFVAQYGYDRVLSVLGRHMRDFLNGKCRCAAHMSRSIGPDWCVISLRTSQQPPRISKENAHSRICAGHIGDSYCDTGVALGSPRVRLIYVKRRSFTGYIDIERSTFNMQQGKNRVRCIMSKFFAEQRIRSRATFI